jgi:hypothetical protein
MMLYPLRASDYREEFIEQLEVLYMLEFGFE